MLALGFSSFFFLPFLPLNDDCLGEPAEATRKEAEERKEEKEEEEEKEKEEEEEEKQMSKGSFEG